MTTESVLLGGVQLRKQFRVKSSPATPVGLLTAVDDVSVEIARGETLGIAGESGCGKSTLAKILAGLLEPDHGRVFFNGTDLSHMQRGEARSFRRQDQCG